MTLSSVLSEHYGPLTVEQQIERLKSRYVYGGLDLEEFEKFVHDALFYELHEGEVAPPRSFV